MSPEWIESFAALGTRCVAATHGMLKAYAALDPLLHDACLVAYLLQPDLFGGQRCAVSIDWREGPTEGQLLAWPSEHTDRPMAANAEVMTELDCARLLTPVLERIARLPGHAFDACRCDSLICFHNIPPNCRPQMRGL